MVCLLDTYVGQTAEGEDEQHHMSLKPWALAFEYNLYMEKTQPHTLGENLKTQNAVWLEYLLLFSRPPTNRKITLGSSFMRQVTRVNTHPFSACQCKFVMQCSYAKVIWFPLSSGRECRSHLWGSSHLLRQSLTFFNLYLLYNLESLIEFIIPRIETQPLFR